MPGSDQFRCDSMEVACAASETCLFYREYVNVSNVCWAGLQAKPRNFQSLHEAVRIGVQPGWSLTKVGDEAVAGKDFIYIMGLLRLGNLQTYMS